MQSNVPPALWSPATVAAGYDCNFAVAYNGSVVGWDDSGALLVNIPKDLTNAVAVATMWHHQLALRANRTVVGWGDNSLHQIDIPLGLTNVVAIAVGCWHSVALKKDGSVVVWGNNNQGQTNVPPGLTNIMAIAAGGHHTLALRGDGRVVAWGYNASGEANVPSTLSGVVAVAAGYSHSLALKSDGTAVGWGNNGNGQALVPTNATNLVSIAAGHYHSLAVTHQGQVVGWGDNTMGQVAVPAFSSAVGQVSGGRCQSLAALVQRLFPVVDGRVIDIPTITVRGRGLVEFVAPWGPSSLVLYTVDGTDPALGGTLYEGPFEVRSSCVLRAMAYDSAFIQRIASIPLTITVVPELSTTTQGGGTLTVDPPDGAYHADGGAFVSAIPDAGWEFLQWLGDASGSETNVTVSMTRPKQIEGVFGTAIIWSGLGAGRIELDPPSALYPYGAKVRLTAIPNAGNYFAFWGGAGSRTNNPITLTVNSANPTIAAVFSALGTGQNYGFTVVPSGGGSVTATPPWNKVPRNTNVVVEAVPDAGQDFLGWSGAVSGTDRVLTLTIKSNMVITATFSQRPALQGSGRGVALAEGGFRVRLNGEYGAAYRIDASTNLPYWTMVGRVTNLYGVLDFDDAGATNLQCRFYRAVKEP